MKHFSHSRIHHLSRFTFVENFKLHDICMSASEWNGWLSEKERQILPSFLWNVNKIVGEWVRSISGLLSTGISNKWKKRYKRHIEKRISKEETFAIVVRGEIGNGYIHTRWDFDMGITFSESSIFKYFSLLFIPFVWLMCM